MAVRLPLYEAPLPLAVEQVQPRQLNSGCRACPLHLASKTVCMKADGQPGGLLVVSDYPGQREDAVGRPMIGVTGQMTRELVKKSWHGPVVYDNALKCLASDPKTNLKAVEHCRHYLAQVIRDARPTRIVAMGATAILALTGRSRPPYSLRRAWTWLSPAILGKAVPVYLLPNPAAGGRNRFTRRWFEVDLQWALSVEAPPYSPAWETVVNVVATPEDGKRAHEVLRAAEWSTLDVETAGIMHNRGFEVLSVSMTPKAVPGQPLPETWQWDRAALRNPALVVSVRAVVADRKVKKVGQSFKFDINALKCGLGVQLQGIHSDTRLKRKLLDTAADADLGLMAELVGMGGHKEEAEGELEKQKDHIRKALQRERKLGPQQALPGFDDVHLVPGLKPEWADAARSGHILDSVAFALLPQKQMRRYNARDALSTALVEDVLDARLRQSPDLAATWDRIVKPAIHAVARVEHWGIGVDRQALEALRLHLQTQLDELRPRFAQYPGFDPGKDRDIAKLLFETLKLPVVKRSDKTGLPSVDAGSLEELGREHKHPVLQDVLLFRAIRKQLTTYAEGLLFHQREDGRVHPTLNIDGAQTGRMSSTEPNLQSITAEDEGEKDSHGEMLKACFVAAEGWKIIQLDYSQIELRLGAAISGDPKMRQIFLDGVDYHLRTAQMLSQKLWGISPDQINKTHRKIVKPINFGLAYGKTVAGFAQENGWTLDYAQTVVDAILGEFQVFAEWREAQVRESKRTGVVWTWWAGGRARMRNLYKIASEDEQERGTAERGSYNTPIQGAASDFCLQSLIALVQWIEDEGLPVKVILTVHDSIMLECPDELVEEVAYKARQIMLQWPCVGAAGPVPLVVDVEAGQSWGSLQKLKLAA